MNPTSTVSPCVSIYQDEEPFNPDYVEVDRILDVSHSVDKDNGEVRDNISFWLKQVGDHPLNTCRSLFTVAHHLLLGEVVLVAL